MAAWVKVKWINPLFEAVNTVAPNRGHDQDGTIGDLAHASGVSGHNPDDTPGVSAERTDADTIPEVRAADVDARGVDMERVVQAVLSGPAAERNRLIYIIYNRRIWQKSNGWKQARYTGDDPHDTHSHWSGDPASDEDGRPWTSILALAGGQEDEDTMQTITVEPTGFTSIAMEPVADGGWPREAYLNVCNDTNGEPYALRAWYSVGKPGEWFELPGWGTAGVRPLKSGEQAAVPLPKGCTCLSISRTSPYAGHLTVAIARGPITK